MLTVPALIVTQGLGSTICNLGYFENLMDLDLVTVTFQGHARSKFIVGKKSLHMVSYLSIIVTMCLGSTIDELEHVENLMDLDLPRSC